MLKNITKYNLHRAKLQNSDFLRLVVLASFLFILFVGDAFAKKETGQRDTIATLVIDDTRLISADELVFKLRLLRHSDHWTAYANGTYQIVFDAEDVKVDKDSLDVSFTGVSDLKMFVSTGGGQMPIDGYAIETAINENNRISIMVAGPEEFKDAIFVPHNDSGIVIGQFILKGKNGFYMPDKLKWLKPYNLFQASAYKLPEDSLISPGVIWQYKNSNIELYDTLGSDVMFQNTLNPGSNEFALDYFNVEYDGQKVINISWKTSSEPYNQGFILKRGYRMTPDQKVSEIEYKDIVASYPPNFELKGTGTVGKGGLYFWQDTVPYRGIDYCYQLEYKKRKRYEEENILLAQKCVPVPNAVIYAANASPNPFKESTEIRFWLEDDVTLTAFVRDLAGKEIERLCTNKMYKFNMKQDPHILPFNASALAANGLYEVVLIGIPINDQNVTQSTAMIKIQLLK